LVEAARQEMEMKVDDESVDLFVFSEPLPASSFMQFMQFMQFID